jgi:hypothetical protein
VVLSEYFIFCSPRALLFAKLIKGSWMEPVRF